MLMMAAPDAAPVSKAEAHKTPNTGKAAAIAAPVMAATTLINTGSRKPCRSANLPAGSASKGTVTFAFDAFATYYPGIIIDVKKLLQARGYELKLVPFGLDTAAPSEAERWAKLKSGEWDVLATTLDGFARQSDPSIGALKSSTHSQTRSWRSWRPWKLGDPSPTSRGG